MSGLRLFGYPCARRVSAFRPIVWVYRYTAAALYLSYLQAVVLADKPVISDDTNAIDPHLLDVLLANISTLASVFHKPPVRHVQGSCSLIGL